MSNKYMNANQIQHELTAPYSPAQNGKAERFNRTLVEMTKFLLKNIPSLAPEHFGLMHLALQSNSPRRDDLCL